MTSVLVYGSAMPSSPRVRKFVVPTVRELGHPEPGPSVPPERRVDRSQQRKLVAASLIACPVRR